MASNALEIKERIISFLERRGPSLPVHIAKETGLSILFASAFLSEILSEKRIKMSYMRVGSSPLYFIPGQETFLENFSHALKKKEKEAFVMLKEQRFLKDEDVEPAIRVALREIRDFAVPFQNEEGIFWRYYKVPEAEFYQSKKQEETKRIEKQQEEIFHQAQQEKTYTQEISEVEDESPDEKTEEIQQNASERITITQKITPKRVEVEDIFDKTQKKTQKKVEKKKPTEKKEKKTEKKSSQKGNTNKFFNRVKTYLSEKQIEILDIEEASNNEIVLKVKESQKEYLIVAYSKKKITDQEITKAYKKSSELNLPYKILALGEPLKKLDNLIEAIKDLQGIEKVD
ncbi:MAG TPA: hypothetical protein PLK34_00240 [Candidatus Pacearchaeota archaeon]|nr:hypothetical protein [Candidatus Pacearchaeota archaeon]